MTTARRRLTRDERRSQLLDVAEAVFADLGFEATSLEVIAARAGVTRPLIYNHFRSKDEIYLECVRAARAEFEGDLVAAVAGCTEAVDQVRAGLTAYFGFVQRRNQRWDVLFGAGAAAGPVAEAVADRRFETAEHIAAIVAAAAPHLPVAHVIAYGHGVSGAAEQIAKMWRRHPEMSLEDVVERAFELIWSGTGGILSASLPHEDGQEKTRARGNL